MAALAGHPPSDVRHKVKLFTRLSQAHQAIGIKVHQIMSYFQFRPMMYIPYDVHCFPTLFN